MDNKHTMKIVIVGGGTAGWMAANLFAKEWANKQIQITLIESPDVGIIGVGEGSTPTLKHFFELMGIEESQWMLRCNATYKTNIRFNNWSPKSGIDNYSHPFTTQVDIHTSRAFMLNCHTRRLGLDTHTQPDDFLLNGILAKKGLSPVASENFPFKIEYGYHFDSHLLGEFLAELAIKNGVSHQIDHIAQVVKHNNGDIAALTTASNNTINGDFFVDCTGFSSVLMQKALGVAFKSYKENLFNDAAVVIPTPITSDIPCETVSTALSAGWCWKIPLTNRFGNGYVYSSDFISTDQAESELRTHLNSLENNTESRHLKMRVGRLEKQWSHNCIGLGLSQGFIEPLEATALHLVQVCIQLFIERFEKGGFTAKFQEEYNNETAESFERVRDYIVAHYKLNTREDSDYWRANRDNKHISDPLYRLLNAWYQREDLSKEIDRQGLTTHFNNISWHCLLSGYGAFPPLAANQPGSGDLYNDKNIKSFLNGCSLNFKKHLG